MKLGQEVWVWRMVSVEQWALTKATVVTRHSDDDITVDFGIPTGQRSNRGGSAGGYELNRYPRSGVYEDKDDAVASLPVSYVAIRNQLA